MKRISLVMFAIVGVVALAQAQTQTQGQHGTQSSPAQVEGANCEACRQKAEACNNESDMTGRAICRRAALQCRCN